MPAVHHGIHPSSPNYSSTQAAISVVPVGLLQLLPPVLRATSHPGLHPPHPPQRALHELLVSAVKKCGTIVAAASAEGISL